MLAPMPIKFWALLMDRCATTLIGTKGKGFPTCFPLSPTPILTLSKNVEIIFIQR
jgi:hypothetical protein